LCVRFVDPDRADKIHAFYNAGPKDFLLPRTPDDLKEMADKGSLFELVNDAGDVLGACYVKVDGDKGTESPAEFGGILLDESVQGQGLAGVLARAALSVFFAAEAHVFMIAHVHVENNAPRELLKKLGFTSTGKTESPPKGFPTGAMRTNAKGEVIGDVLLLQVPSLSGLANWLANYSRSVRLDHWALNGDNRAVTVQILNTLSSYPQPEY
jgi:hypothetical protein